MELFLPDDLCRRTPELTPVVDEAALSAVESLVQTHFRHLGPPSDIRLIAGRNPTTSNFLLATEMGRFVVKRRSDPNARERLIAEAQVAEHLGRARVAAPRPVASSTGEHAVFFWDGSWSINRFEEGEHFTGNGHQLTAAARSFGSLVTAARHLPRELLRPVDENARFLDELEHLVLEARRDPQLAEIVPRHFDRTIAEIASTRRSERIVSEPRVVLHLDFHPLNLLMRDDEVACILDLEELTAYPLTAGLGFAAYKLARRVMVERPAESRQEQGRALVSEWVAGWEETSGEASPDPADLGMGARYRVLALIRTILHRQLRQGDARFLYDLPKQIRSLYEIEVIFPRGID